MPKKSKKTSNKKRTDLNKSKQTDKGNLHEPVTDVIDYGEIPANTPQEKK